MSEHAAVQTQTAARPTITPIVSGVRQRAAVNPSPVHADHAAQPAPAGGWIAPRLWQDFSQAAVHDSDPPRSELSPPCPVTPTRCPFGGACHTCPVQVQTKLAVSKPQDTWPTPQRRAAINASPLSGVPPIVHETLRSPGQPLDPVTRAFMEPRFGHDFSRVRVHTDAKAAESTRATGALAYTVGEHIIFQTGHYSPISIKGRRLLAHELTHVLQQRSRPCWAQSSAQKLEISAPGDHYEQEADRIAAAVAADSVPGAAPVVTASARSTPALQRAGPGPAPACPTLINFSASDPVHVPSCGQFRALTDASGITWSLAPDPTPVDPGTTIAANGNITIAATQAAGQIKAVATAASGCSFERPIRLRSHPTGIGSTVMVAMSPDPVNDYGAVFDHTFVSADGNVASLENVAVGERFIGVPTPTAATHAITAPTNPFGGTFTLHTATLTSNASNNWFLTAAGQLGGNHDTITTSRANVNVGRFVQSASNPAPPQGLPATMTLSQGLHWFCPQAPAATRWRMPAFVTVAHSRTLRNRAGNMEFVTTVNGLEVVETYSGPLALFNLTAAPASTPRTPAAPPPPAGGVAPAGPAARTVRITVDSLPAAIPAGQSISFTLVGNTQGCAIAPDPANDHAAVLTVGQAAGTVTVQAADSSGVNRARVTVVIT